ncbi:TPA: type IV pilus modification PilV family protein [Photobacterium damselae]|uniref:type IV pilus modification PilV family protein n=1 Tax=Photobacterium damselae TaxID=38293 RepID=UPI001245004F|nr:prepilin-type N-terminal cleavage/methylation domain-containing protein [Photobacterium damselae]KAB1183730.1 prepilin-type N-terminal cleavage/methylation domain-containing protein [Photobacterium damselae subsp. damselae]MBF7101469.1 prepilin-type N-terminal cleavage/methylation domain-containing protein [Photobacterium damselae]
MTSKVTKLQGFSLLEVVITLAVLSVGVLGLVKMQAYMEVKAENALKTLDALHIAEAQMEYYQTRVSNISGATGLISFSELAEDDPVTSKLKHCLSPELTVGTVFELDCEVVNASGGVSALSSALKTIEVKVSWSDRHGVSQAVSLKTVLSKYSEFD